MNPVSLISLFVFVLYLETGLYVLLKNSSSRINRWFFYLSLCISLWSLGFVFSFQTPHLSQILVWDKVSLTGWILFPAFLVRFMTLLTNFPRKEKLKTILHFSTLIISILFLIFFIFFAGEYRSLMYTGRGFFYASRPDLPVYIALYVYFFGIMFLSLYILMRWRAGMTHRREKKQFNLTFYPLLIFIVLALLGDILFPLLVREPVSRMAHIFSIFWLGGVAYGILRLRFFTLTPALAAARVITELKQLLFFCDTRGKIVKSNPYTEKLLRIRSSRLPGRKVTELFAEEKDVASYLDLAIRKGFSGPVELTIRTFQGEMVPVGISMVLVKDELDDVQGLMIYGHDNREAIKLRNEIFMREQVEKKLKNLSEMLEKKVKERTSELAGSYKELQVKMTQRQQVEEQIKADIAEKDVLINEIHNRVKSNMELIMALIDTHRNKGFAPGINKKFRELNRRVMAILLIHENLYLSLNYSEVDFASFLKQLVQQLAAFYQREDQVKILFSVSEVFLDIDHAIPLGLVVNELVSNAFSHGFSSYFLRKNKDQQHKLWINFGQQQQRVELIIRNNGKGLPEKFDLFGNQTNGLPLVDVLVNDQINGSFELNSAQGITTARVSFPVNHLSNDSSL